VFTSHPEFDPQVHGGTIVLAESLDDIENAFQDAVSRRPSALPFADICIPSVFDDSLAPEGQHVMSMFTQWVPHQYADAPQAGELAAYADRVIARVETVAPGFTDSILHRQVIGPNQMQQEYGLIGGNIFHGELSLGQMFHARPAAGYADLRTPLRGLYQAGSATHGGGGVTGIPGRNVVRQILADARADRWRARVEFSKELRDDVIAGAITVSFRLWQRPKVRVGGRYRVGAAQIEVDAVELLPFAAITAADVRRSGETDRETLRRRAAHAGPVGDDTLLYRVEFHVTGDGPPGVA
jgi:hypothetical protein